MSDDVTLFVYTGPDAWELRFVFEDFKVCVFYDDETHDMCVDRSPLPRDLTGSAYRDLFRDDPWWAEIPISVCDPTRDP